MGNVDEYLKVFWSANTKSIVKFAVLFAIIIIISGGIDDGLAGFLAFIFFIILLIRVLHVITGSKRIMLTDDAIEINNKKIPWNTIREIKFDRQIYKPGIYGFEFAGILDALIPNQVIIISIDDQMKVRIYPRFYRDNIKLRKNIEDLCIQKNIKWIIRDRGLL
ncbi:hypothetical protein [Dehalobacterium formicoaceticum]|uniref:hypothetical protein n=1 Tax=Dehalobacterium formicoaceticum TaxID=51515 RepID=UPI000B7D269C|nr:hypothetical protein [Dehalobacterium formicoaceticum]